MNKNTLATTVVVGGTLLLGTMSVTYVIRNYHLTLENRKLRTKVRQYNRVVDRLIHRLPSSEFRPLLVEIEEDFKFDAIVRPYEK